MKHDLHAALSMLKYRPYDAGRWAIAPHFTRSGGVSRTMVILRVVTARGTGPKAASVSLISKELARDRRGLAFAIRDVRNAAMQFRRVNEAPDWMKKP